MKRILASIGIGSATVDTILPSTTVTPGESVDAEINIRGGKTDQTVRRIDLELETRYATEDGYRDATIDRFRLAEELTIEPGQEEVRETTIDIPYGTPLTLGRVDVWVETELEIDRALDPEDKDHLDVRPTPRMEALFDAAESLGFSLRTAECEADPYGRYVSGRPFVQEFEFRPQSGPYRGDLDELELVFVPGPDALTVYVEIDRRGGFLSELAGTDEHKTSLTVETTDIDAVADQLRAAIDERR